MIKLLIALVVLTVLFWIGYHVTGALLAAIWLFIKLPMSEELRETERMLFKLEESRKNSMVAVRDLEQTKERLLSFVEYAKDAQTEVLVTLIQTIVERIYIVDKDDERFCHIFIKGCTDEDYTGFFQTAAYIEQKTVPVCDSEQYCICSKVHGKY